MIADQIHKDVSNFECEICGIKLDKQKMNDLIIFAHGKIGDETGQSNTFRETSHTIYIHKQCMKLLINKKFSNGIRKYFNNAF